jgi:glyoxylase-like metal-dependent hydrolase (beta-lactamase superfamily II)
MPEIRTIDLQYLGIPGAIAAYVVMGPPPQREPVLIETGPASTLDQLRAGLNAMGIELARIRHALVTHIHLDHAGAAGHLAGHGTRIYVHEFGARHLIDPSRLIESATRIYGDQMQRLWGTLVPAPEQQVTPVHDGDVLEVGGLRIRAIETPGHARHHHAYSIDDVCFVGDVAGISVPGVPEPPVGRFISVPTPPPEFDPPAWHASIDRLLAMKFSRIYLTHFGACDHVNAHLERLHQWIDAHTDYVQSALQTGVSRDQILSQYIAWNRRQARNDMISDADFAHYVSTNLLTMNVDGILRYLAKQTERAATP